MKSIRELSGEKLIWSQKSGSQEFELRGGDELIATLRWQKPAGSLAVGVSAEGRWTLKRAGFFTPVITARRAGSDVDLAVFNPARGVLDYTGNRRFRWVTKGFFHSEYSFVTEDGRPIVTFKPTNDLVAGRGQMEIGRATTPDLELSLLALLGWYFIVLRTKESDDTLMMTLLLMS
jgi:hypothetical protein